MQWGIFNNLVGMRADVPHVKLPEAMVSDETQWFHYFRDRIRRMDGRVEALEGAQTPDANPIMRYHYHKSSGGLEYLFCFTKEHAYIWSNGTSTWTLMFTCVSECDTWSTENFGQYVVATNNLDLVQYWDDADPTTAFAPIGGANGIQYDGTHYLTRAKVVIRHWNYVHLMNTVEDGTRYAMNDRWCDAGDVTGWRSDHPTGGDSNYRQLSADDAIVGCGIYNVQGANQLITFTQHSVNAAWLVEDDLVYQAADILSGVGCIGADTIINGPDGHLYYMSVDKYGLKQIRRVYEPASLSYDIQPLLDVMHPSLGSAAVASYVSKFRQLWWSYPSRGGSTGNDKVLIYNLETETWQPVLPIGITAFGYYQQQDTTYINDITETINDIHTLINDLGPTSGAPMALCGDSSGYTWSHAMGVEDAGSSYMGQLVLAVTFSGTINEYKRIHGAWLFFVSYPGTSYTATLSLRKGDEADYENLGSVSLSGDGKTVRRWIPFDKRMRDGHIKIAASNPCSFIGILFDYDGAGVRA